MKPIENFRNITPVTDGYTNITAGGYVCRITGVKDYEQKQYLEIEYDIAEGNSRGYYLNLFQKFGFWGARFIQSYKQTAVQYFKAFIDAVEKSNNRYCFEFDENTLVGKYIGLVLGEEEYKGSNGQIKKRLYVHSIKTINEIREGKFKVPDFKQYKENTNKYQNNNQNSHQSQSASEYYEYDKEEDDDYDLPF